MFCLFSLISVERRVKLWSKHLFQLNLIGFLHSHIAPPEVSPTFCHTIILSLIVAHASDRKIVLYGFPILLDLRAVTDIAAYAPSSSHHGTKIIMHQYLAVCLATGAVSHCLWLFGFLSWNQLYHSDLLDLIILFARHTGWPLPFRQHNAGPARARGRHTGYLSGQAAQHGCRVG